MNNYHLSPLFFRQCLQAFRKVQLFCNKQLLAESTDLLESHSLAKNKRSRRPSFNSTQNIPSLRDQPWYQIPAIQLDRASTCEAFARLNCLRDCGKQFGARSRIRIYEYQPITRSDRCPAISRATNLVDWLEDDTGACRPRQFSGAVSGIIVANDQFSFPSQRMKGRGSRIDALERRTDQFLLVKCRNDNRDFHNREGELVTNPF